MGKRTMPHIKTDDGRSALLRGDGPGRSAPVPPRVRRPLPELGTAGPLLLAPLPLHHLRRAGLAAVGRAGRRRGLFAGARGRRLPLGDGGAGPCQGASGRPVDGRHGRPRVRHSPSRQGAVAHHRGRRRRRQQRPRRQKARFKAGLRDLRPAHRARRHAGHGRTLLRRAGPRAVPLQGPARLGGVQAAVRRRLGQRATP